MKYGSCPLTDFRIGQHRSGEKKLTPKEMKIYKDWLSLRSKGKSEAGKMGGRPRKETACNP